MKPIISFHTKQCTFEIISRIKKPYQWGRLVGHEVWNEEREGGETSFHYICLNNMQKTGQIPIGPKKPIKSSFILDRK